MRRRQALAALAGVALAALLVLWLWPRGAPGRAGRRRRPVPALPSRSGAAPPSTVRARAPRPRRPPTLPAPRGAFEGTVRSRGTGGRPPRRGGHLLPRRGRRLGPLRRRRLLPVRAARGRALAARRRLGAGPRPRSRRSGGTARWCFDARPGERVRGLSLWLRAAGPVLRAGRGPGRACRSRGRRSAWSAAPPATARSCPPRSARRAARPAPSPSPPPTAPRSRPATPGSRPGGPRSTSRPGPPGAWW